MIQDIRFEARTRLMRLRGAALAALTLAFGSLQSAPAPDLIIRNVTVIDVASMRAHADQRVVVQGGRIIAIELEQPVAPKASTVIDAKGKFLIPGLWDMHSHLTFYPGLPKSEDVTEVVLPLFVANGVLGTRDMGAVDVARMVRLRDEVEAGKRPGPRLVVSGPQHDGPIATDWTKRRVANAEEARQAVRAIKEAGADFIKVYDRLSPETYLAIAEESRRVGLPFAGHIPLAMTALEAVEAGPGSIEHMGGDAQSSRISGTGERSRLNRDWQESGPCAARTKSSERYSQHDQRLGRDPGGAILRPGGVGSNAGSGTKESEPVVKRYRPNRSLIHYDEAWVRVDMR